MDIEFMQSCELLLDRPTNGSFTPALRMLGEHLGLDRAFVHINVPSPPANRREWRRPGGIPPPDGAVVREHEAVAEQLGEFRFHKMVVIEDTNVDDCTATGIFCPSGHRAIALMPIWDGDRLAGVAGFERFEPTRWPRETLIILRDFSLVVRSILIGEYLKKSVRAAGRQLCGACHGALAEESV